MDRIAELDRGLAAMRARLTAAAISGLARWTPYVESEIQGLRRVVSPGSCWSPGSCATAARVLRCPPAGHERQGDPHEVVRETRTPDEDTVRACAGAIEAALSQPVTSSDMGPRSSGPAGGGNRCAFMRTSFSATNLRWRAGGHLPLRRTTAA